MITNQIMNRGEAAGPAIINNPEFVSSSSDKVNHFASIFASREVSKRIKSIAPAPTSH